MADVYDLLIPWCKLPENVGLTDAQRLASLKNKTIAVVDDVPKKVLVRTLTKMTERLYDVGFDATKRPFWTAMLTLWTSLDSIEPTSAATARVLARAVTESVLTQAEVDAFVASATRTISQLDAWGIDVGRGHLASVRLLIAGGA